MADPTKEQLETILSLYKAYLEDLGRLGSRHETLRAFYLSVISALFVFLSLASPTGALPTISEGVKQLVGGVGILMSVSWGLHMWSFAGLYKAKFSVLSAGERDFLFKPFTAEQEALKKFQRPRLTVIDRFVAGIFAVLFLVLLKL